MSNEVATTGRTSFPLATILTIVFVVLKLTGTIDWSWWWILSPLWISALVVVGLLVIILGIMLLVAMIKR